MADVKDKKALIQATALKHAQSIDEKRKLADRVTDLILEAYDIPSDSNADPASPSQADLSIFRECLRLFRPSDLDELVTERNIDDRCGYALCPKPHRKIPGAGNKVWNRKGGKNFRLLNTADIEKWCSDTCGERTAFVRAQLSSDPAWIRETQNDVKLLDEILRDKSAKDLAQATKLLSLDHAEEEEVREKLQELSLERGETQMQDTSDLVSVVEKDNSFALTEPPKPETGNSIEGYHVRKVRFKNQAS